MQHVKKLTSPIGAVEGKQAFWMPLQYIHINMGTTSHILGVKFYSAYNSPAMVMSIDIIS